MKMNFDSQVNFEKGSTISRSLRSTYLAQRRMHIEKECAIDVPTAHFAKVRLIPAESEQNDYYLLLLLLEFPFIAYQM